MGAETTTSVGERLVQLCLPARPDRLKLIRSVVRDAALISGCSEACAADVVIAVNEACMNVIEHGYRRDHEGEMIVELSVEGDSLVVRLTDFAPPVDPQRIKPREIDELRPGGLGTRFIGECMDETAYVTPPPAGTGNLLRMSKRID
jgi:sigma-B regulation protein RsbU (phosphoserine phosphatase)